MWWRAEPHDLHRMEDRVSTVYVERSHVDRDDNAVVLINKERTVRIPAAMVAAILLGPGTRVTHGAMNLLGDSGTVVCWVGEHGVRMYASGNGPSRSSRLLLRQAHLVSHKNERLAVARRMYELRFPGEDVAALTMQQLRGREGARVKRIYREHARRTGVPWEGRQYRPGAPMEAGDDVNRLLSAGHACLYGLCHAAVVGLGASPGLGFVHTGSSNSFVLDIADLYKAETTVPLAFDLAAEGQVEERDMRLAFRDLLKDGRLLHRVLADISGLLGTASEGSEEDPASRGVNELWDERAGAVSGGVNYGTDDAEDGEGPGDDLWLHPDHQVIAGPEFDEPESEPR
ncbi:type I-E CRISPR-associated endonuclease Cas1 [Nitriliruptoraceae bacterium ZYF776]|nr:type I-E CRISPR-associated endonuclease Cas1 [Profundirhabdus halotolerans]